MTKSTESYFSRVANEILQSAEQIANRMEEGISVVLTGKLPDEEGVGAEPKQEGAILDGNEADDDLVLDEDVDEIFRSSPLQGMADQVLGDIMSSQVRSFIHFFIFE